MITLTADETLHGRLAGMTEEAEIRDAGGALLGVFTPRAVAERKRHESVRALFDLEEADRIMETEKERYTLEEVWRHIDSLEAKG
jgi:hypothetical protein